MSISPGTVSNSFSAGYSLHIIALNALECLFRKIKYKFIKKKKELNKKPLHEHSSISESMHSTQQQKKQQTEKD